MAKLKAPLLSLGASGALGKAIVYFGWKGLDCAREYVVPANPKSTNQTTQRGYLTEVVEDVHNAEGDASHPMTEADKTAYAALGSLQATPRTWFNTVVKQGIDQLVAGLSPCVYSHGISNEAVDQLTPDIWFMTELPTAGNFHYGTSKSALNLSTAATFPVANHATKDIAGLVTGTKYYWQFRATAPPAAVGCNSGIYHGTPD